MAYTYNKPDAGDAISASQSVLKDNFTEIKALVDVNHVTFGDPAQGKHTILNLEKQTVVGGSFPPATSADEYTLYSRLDGATFGLFIRPPNSTIGSTTGEIPLTSSAGIAGDGCTKLPSGLIIKWGASQGRDTVTVTYNTTYLFTTVYGVIVTTTIIPAGSGVSAAQRANTMARWMQPVGTIPTTTFQATCTTLDGITLTPVGVDVFFNYIAIGV
jgi:hypothetical protein